MKKRCWARIVSFMFVLSLIVNALPVAAFADEHSPDTDPTVKVCEYHFFADNICLSCGYINTCDHEGASIVDTGWAGNYEPIEGNDLQHKIVMIEKWTDISCPKCGMSFSNVEFDLEELEDHDFHWDGTCYSCYCGYTKPCEHPSYWIREEIINQYYVDTGSHKEHAVKGEMHEIFYCSTCEFVEDRGLIDTINKGVAVHRYDDDNVCESCGHVNTCTHETIIEKRSVRGKKCEIIEGDSENHSYTGELHVDLVCDTCNWIKEKDYLVQPDYTDVEKHSVSYEGICMACGFDKKAVCAHENTEVNEWYDQSFEMIEGNAVQHKVIYTALSRSVYCNDCKQTVSFTEEPLETEIFELKEHQFAGRPCTLCGYKAECRHENAVFVNVAGSIDAFFQEIPGDDTNHNSHYFEPRLRMYCPDCCQEGETYIVWGHERVDTVEKHEYKDGVCDMWCGHVCTHSNASENVEQETACKPMEGSAVNHGVYAAVTTTKACPDCGLILSEETVQDVFVREEKHSFKNGVCELCGFENTCKHEDVEYPSAEYIQYTGRSIVQVPGDERYHCIKCERFIEGTCLDCGETIVRQLNPSESYDIHFYDENRVCWDCGYKSECTHETVEVIEYFYKMSIEMIPGDSVSHMATGTVRLSTKCANCGKTISTENVEGEQVRKEAHSFIGGPACIFCGYETSCEHANAEVLKEAAGGNLGCREIKGNDKHHIRISRAMLVMHCPDCCENPDDTIKVVYNEGYEWEADHVYINGECNDCLHVCSHADAKETVETTVTGCKAMEGDEANHSVYGTRTTIKACPDCGMELSKTVEENVLLEKETHAFENDTCTACGYQRAPAATPTAEPTAAPTAEPTAAPTAEPTAAPTAEPTAAPTAEPTAAPTAEPTAAPTAEPTAAPTAAPTEEPYEEPYEEPAPAPTAAPTATPTAAPQPEIVYEEVEETKVVNNVSVKEETRIAETLVTAITAIETTGESTSIEIVNIDKVLKAEEKEALDTLPVAEQMLVLLSVIGFQDEVAALTESSEMALSGEAAKQIEAITARMESCTEEEKAAMETLLKESFPVETMEIDGVVRSYFVIELKVVEGSSVRYERYGFCQNEDGKWIFIKLSIGTAAEAK